jgi:hypothetical protein
VVDAIGVYLRNAGFEAPHIVYAFMKPLLAALPAAARGGLEPTRFAARVLGAMWAATDAADWRAETESLMLQCYAECLPLLADFVVAASPSPSTPVPTSVDVDAERSKFVLESIGHVVRAAFAEKCTLAQWNARAKTIVECINHERVVGKSSRITCALLRWLAQQLDASTTTDVAFVRLLDLTSQLVADGGGGGNNAQLTATDDDALRATTTEVVTAILAFFIAYERS